jgi:hypothetical protein
VEDIATSTISVACSVKDLCPQVIATRKSLLVWRYNADSLLQESRVAVRYILVASVVDQNHFARRFLEVFAELWKRQCGVGRVLKLGFPVGEGLVIRVVDSFLGGAKPDEGEVVW